MEIGKLAKTIEEIASAGSLTDGNEAPGGLRKKDTFEIEKNNFLVKETEIYTEGCFQKKRGFEFSLGVLFILFCYRGLTEGIIQSIN